MAVLGAVASLRRRQWALLPAMLFVLVYAAYYVFFVPFVFGWYLSPFAALTLLLCARGLQSAAAVVRAPRARAAAWCFFATAYLTMFAVLLPKTIPTEKAIQERIENQVRKQAGLFLGQVMEKNEVAGMEPLGYISYYSRRIVYDWPGLCSRKVVEFSRSHPREERFLMNMLKFYQPEFLALRGGEYRDALSQTWIDDNYRIIASFEVPYDRNDPLWKSPNIDMEFLVFAKRTWHPGVTEYHGERIGINPRHTRALNSYGYRLLKRGEIAEAVAVLNQAIAACPEFAEPHNQLGLALGAQRNAAGAMAQFRRAIELDPEYALAHNNLGAVLAGQGDYAGAVKELEEAIRCDDEYAEPHANLGALLAGQGKLAEARPHFEAALRIEPNNRSAAEGLKRVNAALARPGAGT